MALSLFSGECSDVSEANDLFTTDKGLLVLRPGGGCCGCCPFFSVPSGCYALVAEHGAEISYEAETERATPVWPAGLHHFYPPWVGVSHLVTKQSVVLDLPVKACKTRDNVTVNIDMSLVFRIMGDAELGEDPKLVSNFVYAVKPKGLEQQLRDAQEEAVRGLARSMRHTEIYGIRSGRSAKISGLSSSSGQNVGSNKNSTPTFGDETKNDDDDDDDDEYSYRDPVLQGTADDEDKTAAKKNVTKGQDVATMMRAQLNKQFLPQGILIQSVMIKSVYLPDDITTQMSDKTMVISQNAAQRMQHENEMQMNRMEQKVQGLMQTFQEQKDQEKSDGSEKLNIEKVKMNDAVSQVKQHISNIEETTKAHIDSLQANSSREVQRVKDSTNAAVVKTETESNKESAELLANTKLQVQTLLSTSELTAARFTATSQLTVSKAEGTIAPWIEKKKAYETDVLRNEVYDCLAQNKDLIVVHNGTTDGGNDMVNLVAVADSILSELDDNPADARTKMVAEMAILHASASSYLSSGGPPNKGDNVATDGSLFEGI